jgi:hypothetical protein
MKPMQFATYATALSFVILSLASCATTSKKEGSDSAAVSDTKDATGQAKAVSTQDNTLTLTAGPEKLGEVVRTIGESVGGNLVLMGGLEARPIDTLTFKRAPMNEVAATLAAKGGLAVQETPEYYFLFPAGYEPLLQVSLSGKLTPADAGHTTDVVFGSGLRLFNVFSWMSLALHRTIIADNAISEARCGELALKQVSLEAALEAILKSARVVAFEVECTDEYIFFRNPKNANPATALLNTEPLEQPQTDALDRKVTVVLPQGAGPNRPVEMQWGPVPLKEVLESLSAQLGTPVVAEKSLNDLPVTPAVMPNVRVRTALDLLVRQWLLPDYGYQVTHDRIVIRKR